MITNKRKSFIICLIILAMTFIFASCSTSATKEVINATDEKTEPYTIHSRNDISIDDVKRYVINVIINKEASKKEIEDIAKGIVEEEKARGSFNAIQILMYDGEYSLYGETMPPLGRYTYAPNGDFAKALDIKSGEYDKMKELSEIKEVDWKLKPSENQQKIISMYNGLLKKESESAGDKVVYDGDIKNEVCRIMGINEEDINDAFAKLDNWVWQE